jgi:replicative DNA helicase
MELSDKARRMKEERGLDLVILDYLQLIKIDTVEDAMGNQEQDFSDSFSALKSVARELNVPIIVLSQLPRSVEQRPTKRPKLNDLREWGDLEPEADIIMFMYCEEFYFPETENKHITEINVAKNLRGSLGTVNMLI